MQKRLYCVLTFLLIMNLSFSQSIRETICAQLDKIACLKIEGKEFEVSAFAGNRVYILQREKDSLSVISYATIDNVIDDAYLINVNSGKYKDTSFTKTVDSLYEDIRRNRNYLSYSEKVLDSGNFFLTFWDDNKLQILSRKEASQNQTEFIKYIINRLNFYSVVPFKSVSIRLTKLNVTSLNGLLKYLKSGTVDSLPNRGPIRAKSLL